MGAVGSHDAPSGWLSAGCCSNISKQNGTIASSLNQASIVSMGRQNSPTNGEHFKNVPPIQEQERAKFFVLSQNGQAAMLDVFLQLQGPSFDLGMLNEEGKTALHVAAARGKIQSCKVLLRRGADLKPDAQGRTPYDLAMMNGHLYCASLLRARLENGENVPTAELSCCTTRSDSWPSESPSEASARASSPSAGTPTPFLVPVTYSSPSNPLALHAKGSPAQIHTPSLHRDEGNEISGTVDEMQAAQMGDSTGITYVRALYDYNAAAELPFLPDERPEISLRKGQRFHLLHKRKDGWCIVRDPVRVQDGFAPGNYLTANGIDSLVSGQFQMSEQLEETQISSQGFSISAEEVL